MPKMKTERNPLHREIIEFVQAVGDIAPTHDDWTGKGVAVTRMDMKASKSQREEVNMIGETHGCHSCLTKVDTDKNQPWIGDHSPPTGLTPKARAVLGLPDEAYDGTVKLRPQCDSCSIAQANTVARINEEVRQGLKPDLNKFGERLLGVIPSKHNKCINASGAKVKPPEGESIQRLGTIYGCHSCGTRYPKDIYHADHCPPVCYTYSHVIRILKYADENIPALKGISIHQDFELRPQCPRCSHEQGGKMKHVADWSKELAKKIGITVYA